MTDPSEQVVRANDEHYARPGAFNYVTDQYHSRRLEVASRLLRRYLPPSEEGLVMVDIGPGDTTPISAEDYPNARRIGIDASKDALERSSAYTDQIVADVSQGLPLEENSVDAIFCGELVEHLFDPIEFLNECHRVLVPGGLLLLTTPNIATLQDRIRFLVGGAPRHINPLHPYIRLHIRPFTPELLKRALRASGFVLLALRSNYVDFHFRGRRYNFRALARLRPTLGGTIIALGVKPVV